MAINRYVKFVFLFILISVQVFPQHEELNLIEEKLPEAQREFRAAWIATVANINWPSRNDLTTEEQKGEAIKLLDLLKNNNFNAVVFQARPQCDALYKSDLEPWSFYLTGSQGKEPDPYYDPLEFWVDEAHKRGMELHVWLNPYRAHHIEGGEVSEFSVVKEHPDWVVKLKSGYWWLDPSLEETQNYSLSVVMDITNRYDIDGIHFDDYFYPYPSYNDDEDFPDENSWQAYLQNNGKLKRDDWRRDNINKFIQRVYKGIKDVKPNVKFGLSPFGVWKPGYPASIEGFDQYDKLYADAKLWINEGWVDYWSPQLYWKISSIGQSYPVLLGWWKSENKMNRHFWPGINIVRDNNELNTIEVINQIMVTRGMLPESPGNVHWSIAPLISYTELTGAILKGPYKKQALIPSTPWFKGEKPEAPKISTEINADSVLIKWEHPDCKNIFNWVVYYKYGKRWDYKILTAETISFKVPLNSEYSFINESGNLTERKFDLSHIAVSAVDRISNESRPTLIEIK